MGNFSGRVSTSLTFRVPTTRPKVFNATLPHLSVARDHSRRLSREQNAPSRSRGNLGSPPVSRTRYFAHETTSEDPFVSRTRCSAHETTSADPFVSISRRFAHETTLAYPFVSRTRYFAHETTSEDPSVSRTRLFTHETAAKDTRGNRGAFSSSYGDSMETLRALYGDSTGAPRCRRGETRASATHRETWRLSGR